jgi:hypothetical protein
VWTSLPARGQGRFKVPKFQGGWCKTESPAQHIRDLEPTKGGALLYVREYLGVVEGQFTFIDEEEQ